MEFIRNIMIIDKSADQADQIKKLILGASNKFNVFSLKTRSQVAEITSNNNINCLFINANIGNKEAFFILRFFFMMKEKDKSEIPIFLTAEDFDFFQDVLQEFPFQKLTILPTPVDTKDLVNKIQIATIGKVSSARPKSSNDKLNVDLEFMNVFIQNSRKIIIEMAQLSELKHSAPILMSQVKEPLNLAISGKILISSVYFKGSYYVSFPKETFLNFYEKVVMEKCTDITDDNKDFAGELANIIYGQCKKKFSESGFNLDMVIPSIHMGDIKYDIVFLIPFESSMGKFYLAIAPGLI